MSRSHTLAARRGAFKGIAAFGLTDAGAAAKTPADASAETAVTRPSIEFWFEFASTYSYLSAMRLPDVARSAGAEVIWRPFLLGPILAEQGWSGSPFSVLPVKGAYMWRDVARRATRFGLGLCRPDPFPQNGLLAARVATAALGTDAEAAVTFVQEVYIAQFGAGRDISDPETIADCAAISGLSEDAVEAAQAPEIKQTLRESTGEAARRGMFGAPNFIARGELFWGDDRLEDALEHAKAP